MNKEKRAIEFYVLCNKLKDVVRSGWKDWGVQRQRVESVAEHIYGVQMLAIAMCSEYKYQLDIKKVLALIAVHELEETVIGDITCYQKSAQEKDRLGRAAVEEIFKKFATREEIKALVDEYKERKTAEAKFVFFCDKLECDIQAKLYDEQKCVDLDKQENNDTAKDIEVKKLLSEGLSWSEMWMTIGQRRYGYDENFMKVSNFAKNNKILDKN